MKKIFHWAASRSGDSMTINGFDAAGRPIKVTKVSGIYGPTEHVPAIRARGEHGLFELATDAIARPTRGAA